MRHGRYECIRRTDSTLPNHVLVKTPLNDRGMPSVIFPSLPPEFFDMKTMPSLVPISLPIRPSRVTSVTTSAEKDFPTATCSHLSLTTRDPTCIAKQTAPRVTKKGCLLALSIRSSEPEAIQAKSECASFSSEGPLQASSSNAVCMGRTFPKVKVTSVTSSNPKPGQENIPDRPSFCPSSWNEISRAEYVKKAAMILADEDSWNAQRCNTEQVQVTRAAEGKKIKGRAASLRRQSLRPLALHDECAKKAALFLAGEELCKELHHNVELVRAIRSVIRNKVDNDRRPKLAFQFGRRGPFLPKECFLDDQAYKPTSVSFDDELTPNTTASCEVSTPPISILPSRPPATSAADPCSGVNALKKEWKYLSGLKGMKSRARGRPSGENNSNLSG